MKHRLFVILVILTMVVSAALVAGCGGSGKEIKTGQGSVKVNDTGSKVEATSNDGKSSAQLSVGGSEGEEAALPSDYPKDLVPIMEKAKLTGAMRQNADKKVNYVITFTIDKAPRDVYDYYLGVMKNAADMQKLEMDGTYTVLGTLEGKSITIGVASQEEEGKKLTTATITVTQ